MLATILFSGKSPSQLTYHGSQYYNKCGHFSYKQYTSLYSKIHPSNSFISAIPILSEWCSWSLSAGEAISARAQLEEVLRRAGADPLSGKIFWDAKFELEKAKLDNMK